MTWSLPTQSLFAALRGEEKPGLLKEQIPIDGQGESLLPVWIRVHEISQGAIRSNKGLQGSWSCQCLLFLTALKDGSHWVSTGTQMVPTELPAK